MEQTPQWDRGQEGAWADRWGWWQPIAASFLLSELGLGA